MIERVRAVLVTADDTMLVIRRAKPDIVRLLHMMESDDERQLFYLARIVTWSFEDRTGPEFSAEGRGEYALEEIPLTVEGSDVPRPGTTPASRPLAARRRQPSVERNGGGRANRGGGCGAVGDAALFLGLGHRAGALHETVG
ncbi:hypothetical protein [Streptomyces sp. SPB4]|uniref:hypothetical protein n=1 Tax=Streptomyces sp. SPB4 TaxID=2940553 RepID=UPI00247619C4|nr:hypothetical protein [Streptomyces sp. SPB4]MDH6544215.1 hypothetical protein [Streptomyces sp. SPB4]